MSLFKEEFPKDQVSMILLKPIRVACLTISRLCRRIWYAAGVFLLFLPHHSCNTNNRQKENNIIIRGTLRHPGSDPLYLFSFPDTGAIYRETKEITDTAYFDHDGNYSFSISAAMPMTFDIGFKGKTLAVNLFACPGDRLEINFPGNDQLPEIDPGTPAGKFNKFLVLFLETFYVNPANKQEYYISTNYMDGTEFAKYNERRRSNQYKLFEDYYGGDSVRKEYKNYLVNTIEYGIGVDRLMYVWKKRMKNLPVTVDAKTYFNFETPSYVQNGSAFYCPAYIRFLNLYIKDIYDRKIEQGEISADSREGKIPAIGKYGLAEKLLSRPFRDV
jgi:hypothetical protein